MKNSQQLNLVKAITNRHH